MYSDMDLDANDMELEFQASFESLFYWINADIARRGGQVDETDVQILFNRDILVNETESIENCVKSQGLLSKQTIVEMHPWIVDPKQELDRIEDEQGGEYITVPEDDQAQDQDEDDR